MTRYADGTRLHTWLSWEVQRSYILYHMFCSSYIVALRCHISSEAIVNIAMTNSSEQNTQGLSEPNLAFTTELTGTSGATPSWRVCTRRRGRFHAPKLPRHGMCEEGRLIERQDILYRVNCHWNRRIVCYSQLSVEMNLSSVDDSNWYIRVRCRRKAKNGRKQEPRKGGVARIEKPRKGKGRTICRNKKSWLPKTIFAKLYLLWPRPQCQR